MSLMDVLNMEKSLNKVDHFVVNDQSIKLIYECYSIYTILNGIHPATARGMTS